MHCNGYICCLDGRPEIPPKTFGSRVSAILMQWKIPGGGGVNVADSDTLFNACRFQPGSSKLGILCDTGTQEKENCEKDFFNFEKFSSPSLWWWRITIFKLGHFSFWVNQKVEQLGFKIVPRNSSSISTMPRKWPICSFRFQNIIKWYFRSTQGPAFLKIMAWISFCRKIPTNSKICQNQWETASSVNQRGKVTMKMDNSKDKPAKSGAEEYFQQNKHFERGKALFGNGWTSQTLSSSKCILKKQIKKAEIRIVGKIWDLKYATWNCHIISQ